MPLIAFYATDILRRTPSGDYDGLEIFQPLTRNFDCFAKEGSSVVIKRLLPLILLVVIGSAPSLGQASSHTPAPQPPTDSTQPDLSQFDGEWLGELRTSFGGAPCGMSYRLQISVAQGAVTGGATRGGERFTVYGDIGADGALNWTASSGRGGASGKGKIDGDSARGDWEDDTGQCTGTFKVEKGS